MEKIDIAIIGAGVIGLALASELTLKFPKREIYVLEKEENFGQGASSRNSEVIHAGIYYPANTLKAQLCKRGRELLYQIETEKVPYKKTGKLIVATRKPQISKLEKIFKNATENEIKLSILDEKQIAKIEPEIKAVKGLLSPETGILNSHKLMQYLLLKTKENIKIDPVLYEQEVISIEQERDSYLLTTNKQQISSRIIVNCAGLHSDKIAKMVGINKESYNIHFCKGEYFSIRNKHRGRLKHLIYPIPEEIGLGIHTVVDLMGDIKLGPNSFFVNKINYKVNKRNKRQFYDFGREYLPFLELEDLSPAMSGIRAKLQTPENHIFRDFIIQEESKKGFPGFINLIGIESPGLTASLAIAEYVRQLIDKIT